MAFIRPYSRAEDFQYCIDIFRQTCSESLKTEPLWTISSYIWCRPYLHLTPETCFVLDDGTGQAVGYCIGTSNTATFCQRWKKEFVSSLDRGMDRVLFEGDGVANGKSTEMLEIIWSAPEKGCDGDVEGLWEAFPGHLHIDILPSHQRQGYGSQLIETLLEKLRAMHCPGVFLGVGADNVGAVRLYEKSDFSRYGRIEQNGELGRKGGTIVMTKRLH